MVGVRSALHCWTHPSERGHFGGTREIRSSSKFTFPSIQKVKGPELHLQSPNFSTQRQRLQPRNSHFSKTIDSVLSSRHLHRRPPHVYHRSYKQ